MARKLFRVWNQSYKPIDIMAIDSADAIQVAMRVRHCRRSYSYRRMINYETHQMEFEDDLVAAASKAGVSGVITRGPDNEILIDGKPIE